MPKKIINKACQLGSTLLGGKRWGQSNGVMEQLQVLAKSKEVAERSLKLRNMRMMRVDFHSPLKTYEHSRLDSEYMKIPDMSKKVPETRTHITMREARNAMKIMHCNANRRKRKCSPTSSKTVVKKVLKASEPPAKEFYVNLNRMDDIHPRKSNVGSTTSLAACVKTNTKSLENIYPIPDHIPSGSVNKTLCRKYTAGVNSMEATKSINYPMNEYISKYNKSDDLPLLIDQFRISWIEKSKKMQRKNDFTKPSVPNISPTKAVRLSVPNISQNKAFKLSVPNISPTKAVNPTIKTEAQSSKKVKQLADEEDSADDEEIIEVEVDKKKGNDLMAKYMGKHCKQLQMRYPFTSATAKAQQENQTRNYLATPFIGKCQFITTNKSQKPINCRCHHCCLMEKLKRNDSGR
ncbi:uncharacterized protein LOC119683538 [Teleopsis dalmanni]|uniref:uncharacterized protein LOC119683538 n=1 Tax=Teleopsis dalmanni TaxID=139649 RepID=UPI0018CF2E56|nr:uncharacterized protein LOC119683538 [Teleopsis dalmanni]XP_037953175.1 uncharacterized protein LOC119683538 [Teleopsis dalmanni]XP_037953176.1 uncharacterized protein LOC119683538 [Teleopsis dalmanni]XP_037953177.1 uncharacterized protein LOC119683538 [Teleopsis dalmanni]